MSPALQPAPILVTGGAGFIGKATVALLAKSGFSVRAGLRMANPQVPFGFPCNLDNPGEVRTALRGASAAVHTAYGSHAAMTRQCNTLLGAMEAEGVENLIHLSSIAVYGGQAGKLNEASPLAGDLDDYARAKCECEELVRAWASSGDRRAIILRPGIVYGAARSGSKSFRAG